MNQLTALSVSIALLGGVWVYIALGTALAPLVLVWAAFIAWGCFFHTGGDNAALQKTIAGMVYGSVIAGVAVYLHTTNPLGLPAGAVDAAVYVGATVFLLVIVAGNNLLSVVPANVYGYAATVAYILQTPTAGSVTSAGLGNPVVMLSVSFVIGGLFGLASGKLAGVLGK